MTFQEKLSGIIEAKNSLVCVGLDIDFDQLPKCLLAQTKNNVLEAAELFARGIIDATKSSAAAYKVNTAFFEAEGQAGWGLLEHIFKILLPPTGALMIADGKRGDIGNTSIKYAKTMFQTLGADAMTASPFMGDDSVAPFLANEEKGVFFLCLTSNAGSKDFQQLPIEGGGKLFHHTARVVNGWNKLGNCGLVVGATKVDELAGIREKAPSLPILIPAIGKQGGDLRGSVDYGTDQDGNNALINASRTIIFASSGEDFAEKAGEEAKRLCEEINNYRMLKESARFQ
jgi:orotidine-5'-phosphate decarboxylase